nr:N-6 DNA methylase [uncultured Mediterraneibacter sp.]
MNGKREYGDYQTPNYFSLAVCQYLKKERHLTPSVIIEPTCGTGSFVKSSLIFNASEIIGIEINPEYCKTCKKNITDPRVHILNSDIFTIDFKSLTRGKDQVLIVGNPPWVNNSTLSVLGSDNVPTKKNFKEFRGVDAITGASNFDISESIILKLITALHGTNATIAMLCKTSVARNIFVEMKRTHTKFASCDILEFNANKIFRISVSACLLIINLSSKDVSSDICNVYSFDRPADVIRSFGYANGEFYSNIAEERTDFSGNCCFEWRQGIKHDCSKVMELSLEGKHFVNGLKEPVDIEKKYVFPLIKSSMFKSPIISDFSKYVLVTQKKVRENTSHIADDSPRTWGYLVSHRDLFRKRKSSIYRNAPDFSMFGIGEYSYAQYKVGVSGFYKKPLFSVLVSPNSVPVMTDDTSYFICLPTYDTAYVAMLILNSSRVQKFLSTIAFLDAKRPYTKKVLERIDFHKILRSIQLIELIDTERELGLKHYLNENMLNAFRLLPELNRPSKQKL